MWIFTLSSIFCHAIYRRCFYNMIIINLISLGAIIPNVWEIFPAISRTTLQKASLRTGRHTAQMHRDKQTSWMSSSHGDAAIPVPTSVGRITKLQSFLCISKRYQKFKLTSAWWNCCLWTSVQILFSGTNSWGRESDDHKSACVMQHDSRWLLIP